MSLAGILRLTEERVKTLKAHPQAGELPRIGDFLAHLRSQSPAIIAEIKLASPSLGAIALDARPVEVAREYLRAGAAALSILTEPGFFRGSLDYLIQVRAAFPEAAILRKDFIIDEAQLLETRLAGADACLLIAAILEPDQLRRLFERSRELGLCPLVEVHNRAELELALTLEAPLIGVNNRNLSTLEISRGTCRELAPGPSSRVFVAESGIDSGRAVAELRSLGYQGFLVGSSLMPAPGERLRRLLAEAREAR